MCGRLDSMTIYLGTTGLGPSTTRAADKISAVGFPNLRCCFGLLLSTRGEKPPTQAGQSSNQPQETAIFATMADYHVSRRASPGYFHTGRDQACAGVSTSVYTAVFLLFRVHVLRITLCTLPQTIINTSQGCQQVFHGYSSFLYPSMG